MAKKKAAKIARPVRAWYPVCKSRPELDRPMIIRWATTTRTARLGTLWKYIPIIIADARHYRVVPRKGARRG